MSDHVDSGRLQAMENEVCPKIQNRKTSDSRNDCATFALLWHLLGSFPLKVSVWAFICIFNCNCFLRSIAQNTASICHFSNHLLCFMKVFVQGVASLSSKYYLFLWYIVISNCYLLFFHQRLISMPSYESQVNIKIRCLDLITCFFIKVMDSFPYVVML